MSWEDEIEEWKASFSESIDKLKKDFPSECLNSLLGILKEFEGRGLYAVAIYHCGNYSGYLLPTVLCDEGLEVAAKKYVESDNLTLSELKSCLRWSPCDSPFHDLSHEFGFTKTMLHLDNICGLMEELDSLLEEYDLYDDNDDSDEYIRALLSIKGVLNNTIRQVLADSRFESYRSSGGIVYLTCGDTSHEDITHNVSFVNGDFHAEKVSRELDLASSLFIKRLKRAQR